MATVKLSFFSDILRRVTEVNVLLPQKSTFAPQVGRPPFPVLYLLHGLGDNHNSWQRSSSVERYAEQKNLCVVLPGTDRGFYTDTTYGTRHFTYITEELPAVLSSYFHISTKREDTFACGLSMGGYGALKLALRLPERYAAAAALSPAPMSAFMHKVWMERNGTDSEFIQEMETVFGTTVRPEDDIFTLCETASHAAQKPRIFLCCGEEDFLFDLNLRLKSKLEEHSHNLHWQQHPKTAHEWSYWDKMVQEVLEWLPIKSM